jgi:MFS family permease
VPTLRFPLVLLMTAFVGTMVGVERSVIPLLAHKDLGAESHLAALQFVVSFGLAKAAANLYCGQAASRLGYRKLLVVGWLSGLMVPLLLFKASAMWMLALANLFLGVNQGLCWSVTVLLALAACPSEKRGWAMGVNECCGYVAMAVAAYGAGLLAIPLGLRAAPALLGALACLAGLALTLSGAYPVAPASELAGIQAFVEGFRNRALAALNQAGMVNNIKDGAAWGLMPLLYAAIGLSLGQGSFLVALYPGAWGISQLWTGHLSDRFGRRPLIVGGLLLQTVALAGTAALPYTSADLRLGLAGTMACLLGLGAGMVHPTCMAAVGDAVPLERRAQSMGVYRMWRDSGYAVGALIAGVLADQLGLSAALGGIALVTAGSAGLFALLWRA